MKSIVWFKEEEEILESEPRFFTHQRDGIGGVNESIRA